MGFFDFLKKITKEEVEEKPQEEIEFKDIEKYIKEKEREIELRNEETFKLIQDKIKQFTGEIKEKVIILEKLDVNAKKAEEKFKQIVKEGRKTYIYSLNHFLEKLESIKKEKPEVLFNKIDNIFLEFNKNTHLSYHRTTILIGKEIAVINESITSLSKELLEIFNNRKPDIELTKKFSLILDKLNNLKESDKNTEKLKQEFHLINQKLKESKEIEKKIEKKIEEIKESKEYSENIEKIEKVNIKEKELNKEILKLKESIDFKTLSNIFHVDDKKMNLVKNFKDDFKDNFQKDKGKTILGLINETNLNQEKILEKINQINEIQKEIDVYRNEIPDNPLLSLEKDKEGLILEIENLNKEIIYEEKKQERVKETKEEIISSIKQEFEKIKVTIK
jgi:hypothetical protein